MKIDLLYFDGCPSWQQGLENLKVALAAENIHAEINLLKVENNDQAARLKFLGSPSFHIDGADMWAEDRSNYALSCRVYSTHQGFKGVANVEMLRQRLKMIHSDNPKGI
jgi:hypothetical protein